MSQMKESIGIWPCNPNENGLFFMGWKGRRFLFRHAPEESEVSFKFFVETLSKAFLKFALNFGFYICPKTDGTGIGIINVSVIPSPAMSFPTDLLRNDRTILHEFLYVIVQCLPGESEILCDLGLIYGGITLYFFQNNLFN